MRQYRTKRKDNGEWVYGWYVKIQKSHYICNPVDMPPEIFQFQKRNGEFVNAISGLFSPMYKVDPVTVGQSTGLKDEDGQEIYEGDILSKTKGSGNRIVDFAKGQFEIGKGQPLWTWEHACKVVGTIYDDSELLEDNNG